MYRSIRKGLSPKFVGAIVLFSMVGLSFQAQAFGSTEGEHGDQLGTVICPASPFEPPYLGHYDSDRGYDDWNRRDDNVDSGTYGEQIPVEKPDPAILCPEIDAKMALNHCDIHPYQEANGCGSNDWLGLIIPNTIPGTNVNVTNSCNEHDDCYGGLGKSREQCDVEFGRAIREQCTDNYQNVRNQCIDLGGGDFAVNQCISTAMDHCSAGALGYQSAVTGYGQRPYREGQLMAACAALRALKFDNECPE